LRDPAVAKTLARKTGSMQWSNFMRWDECSDGGGQQRQGCVESVQVKKDVG